jgi:hypothetical protein
MFTTRSKRAANGSQIHVFVHDFGINVLALDISRGFLTKTKMKKREES